jgi:hypothetical protein
MRAQLITYQLQDISQAEYLEQMAEPDAPVLAKIPGLISKPGWQTKRKTLLEVSICGRTKLQWKTSCILIL